MRRKRWHSDLNRGWRLCRPLPYHLAMPPEGPYYEGIGQIWSRGIEGVGNSEAITQEPVYNRFVLVVGNRVMVVI